MIIKNGYVIIDNKLTKKDVEITGNIISKVADDIQGSDTLDASDCLIMPGAFDVHVHLRQPGYEYKETIASGTNAAAKGGVTSILTMPNLNPCPHNLENLKVQQDIIDLDSVVNAYPSAAVSVNEKGIEIADLENLCQKVIAITDDGVGVNNLEILTKAMEIAKKYDVVMASHAEDSINGKLPEGEYNAVRREIELAKKIGCKYHFMHMSTKESFEAIRKAHQEGYSNITCEVSPHHLLLNSSMIKNGNYKMNPPLREESNRLETIKALLDGTACIIASDHAPHSFEEKNKEYEKCLNGIIGIETMLPLIYTHFIKTNKASLNDFVNWFVNNPRKLFKLDERKIQEGYIADIAVLDIKNVREYKEEEILSLSHNCPYIGMKMTGFARYTLVNGKLVWRDKYEI